MRDYSLPYTREDLREFRNLIMILKYSIVFSKLLVTDVQVIEGSRLQIQKSDACVQNVWRKQTFLISVSDRSCFKCQALLQ